MKKQIPRLVMFLFITGVLFLGTACARQSTTTVRLLDSAPGSYVPGLGEIMSFQQVRHAKLWYAGQAENWELAAYEIDELSEGFDDVVKFHPTHKESPVAPKDAIPRMVTEPLNDLRGAVEKKDARAFRQAYDDLTASCNRCHEATNFGFNMVQTPAMNPYPNQVFTRQR